MQKKLRNGKSGEKRIKIAEGRRFVYLIMFMKLVFRQSNIAGIAILSLLIVTEIVLLYFSGSDSYVIMCFLRCVAIKIG